MKTLGFGEKLRTLRLAAGLGVAGLSCASRVPEKTIQAIESGRRAPSCANFVRLLQALHVKNLRAVRPEDLE